MIAQMVCVAILDMIDGILELVMFVLGLINADIADDIITTECNKNPNLEICPEKDRIIKSFSVVGILGIVGFILICLGDCCRLLQIATSKHNTENVQFNS